jgi:hypothetical protein
LKFAEDYNLKWSEEMRNEPDLVQLFGRQAAKMSAVAVPSTGKKGAKKKKKRKEKQVQWQAPALAMQEEIAAISERLKQWQGAMADDDVDDKAGKAEAGSDSTAPSPPLSPNSRYSTSSDSSYHETYVDEVLPIKFDD